METHTDEYYMKLALNEAMDAYESDEVPVGAIVVLEDKVIARGHNLTETLKDVTAHAEMMSITAAANGLGAKYLKNCTLYVTLEPCIMCAGAIMHSQLGRLVYGASDPKKGYTTLNVDFFPKNLKVEKGVLAEECSILLKNFFQDKR
ncbi:MAG: nucleoside deaminase [Bacteroidales bacterium]|nr:nucleoside deaminase [Bacteroidales bacterium]